MHHYIIYRRVCVCLSALLLAIGICADVPARAASASANTTHFVALPLVINSPASGTLQSSLAPEQIALAQTNHYRAVAGVPPLQLHPSLVAAAQHHATYAMLNADDTSAWEYGAHGEVAGKPGFTGRRSGDRAVAAGFPWSAGWEVMSYVDDPIRSVDAWMATVFHRTLLLDPFLEYMGYGHGSAGTTHRVDVLDLGHAAADSDRHQVIVYPAPGQRDVPAAWQGREMPDPLPPNTTYPVGYPITIQPIAFVPLAITQAELRDGAGAPVAVYPNPQACGTDCYALIAVAPLQAAATYSVYVAGTVDGVAFDKSWSFTTAP